MIAASHFKAICRQCWRDLGLGERTEEGNVYFNFGLKCSRCGVVATTMNVVPDREAA